MSNPEIASVFVDTGVAMQVDPLFHVPGLMPVTLNSSYRSDLDETGPLGWGRIGDADPTLRRLDDGRLEYRDAACMGITFDRPTPNPGQWNRSQHVRFMEIAAGPDRTFMVREEGRVQHFAKSGQGRWHLVGVENQNGARLLYTRDKQGLLLSIDTPEGLRLEFQNDGPLRTGVALVGRDGARRDVLRYAYDGAGNLTLAECIYGAKHEYRYDADHRRIWARINDQHEATFTFDADGRCVHEATNGAHNGTTFHYDPELRITTHTPSGDSARTTRFYYDAAGATFAEAHVSGRFKRMTYNSGGQITSEQDGNGHKVHYKYAPTGELSTIEDEESRIADFRWTDTGEMEFAIDPNGATWSADYDEFGNLIATSDAAGHQTDIAVNAMGQPEKICRHDGLIRFMTYDGRHWLTSMVDFDGIDAELSRDGFGRITAITRAGQEHSRYDYADQHGADFWVPSAVRLPGGMVYETRVVTPRREVIRTDGPDREVTYVIDGFGNVQEMREAGGTALRYGYDAQDDLAEVENAAGSVWRFERDGMGRIVRETDFSGAQTVYDYDAADHLIRAVFADGTTYEIDRDKSGLILEETVKAPDQGDLVTLYDYDDRGLIASVTNADAKVEFERDANGRVTAETLNGVRVSSSYDCCGRRTDRGIEDDIVHYAYDGTGRLAGMTVGAHAPLILTRDAVGHETARRSSAGFALQQQFNVVGLLLAQKMDDPARPSDPSIQRQLDWTPAFEPDVIRDTRWGETRFTYARNGQVVDTGLGNGARETFDYDSQNTLAGAGYRTPGTAQAQALADAVQAWTAGADGRITHATGPLGETVTLSHDPRGRVTERTITQNGFRPKTWRFSWNSLNRLVTAHTPDGHKWTYGYDPFGRRLWKQEWRRVGATDAGQTRIEWTPGVRHDFIWDGDVVARETITQGDARRVIHWYHDPGTFVPVARQEGGALSYVITDYLGTPREVVSQSGHLEWAAEYRTWGGLNQLWHPGETPRSAPVPEDEDYWITLQAQQPRSDGSAAQALVDPDPSLCPIRFQGQWADIETGLHYNRHRYYDPSTGSYLSPDPVGLLGGTRPFGYVARPTGELDPNGLNAALRRALGMTTGNGMQAHHLIPKNVWNANQSFFDAIGMGGDRDVAANGIGLPNNQQRSRAMGLPYHCGSHPVYDTGVRAALQPIIDDYNNGVIDAATAQTRVGALQQTLRSGIQARPGGTRIF